MYDDDDVIIIIINDDDNYDPNKTDSRKTNERNK